MDKSSADKRFNEILASYPNLSENDQIEAAENATKFHEIDSPEWFEDFEASMEAIDQEHMRNNR